MNTAIAKTSLAAAALGLLGATSAASAAEYATVVSATPITTSVAAPRQECFQTEQLVQQQPSGAGALIGAIAGGVVGNQFGHGFGRAAATGLGVVAGSAIGNNVEAGANPPTTVPVQRCRTVQAYEQRIVGYDVVYDYHGQRYSTRLPNDPGARLAIEIRPAGNAPLDRGGPPTTTYSAVPPAIVDVSPSYIESPTSYAPAPAAYYAPAPATYYAPAPAYYNPASVIAPALIGAGIGYWIGNTWHRGHRHYHHGWRGGRRGR
jgi:uncharacterized protein YcfJ